tara:strand:- start:422 stop:895 length:474 start_codon:yes stop_codon:yes gene_type:complete
MIKTSLIALLSLAMGCASCNPKHTAPTVDPYENLTANNIAKECPVPADYHFIPGILVIEVPMKVIRFKDCLSQPDILVMSFPGENNELVRTYAHMLMLLYVDSVKETTGAVVEPSLVKSSQLTSFDGEAVENEVWFIVYKLTPKVVEAPPADTDTAP